MTSLRLVVSLSLMAACYQREPDVYTTMPEPVAVQGPPGGEIDPAWQPGYVDDNSSGAVTGSFDVTIDQSDPQSVTAQCTDGEIDSTLAGYGEWVDLDGYGRVWRPYTTAVGVNFTPYESCGSWVWSEFGWTFACEWDWGWLPFHYGRWGWFDDYWAWQPGYDWSPAWVDWRGGSGYVGWRPSAPLVRDHRGASDVAVRDHRDDVRVRDHRIHKSNDWQWRFAAAENFGKPRIRAHLFKEQAEALRLTTGVRLAPVRATVQQVRAQSIMHSRFAKRFGARDHSLAPARPTPSGFQPTPSTWREERRMQQMPSPPTDASSSVYAPGYQQPMPTPRSDMHGASPQPTAQASFQAIVPASPPRAIERPTPQPNVLQPATRSYGRPTPQPNVLQPSPRSYTSPSYTPSSSYTNPSHASSTGYTTPSRSSSTSYSAPSSSTSYSAPSRASSAPSSYSSSSRASAPSAPSGGRRR